ncbi:hypothetical protein FACS1894219_08870 [Clostridia bacterium]|nr:hypothetical protein FACS1894219_08870 [Clostridia bacterium]
MAEENKDLQETGDKAAKKPDKKGKEKVKLSERFTKFIRDYKSELKKIVWPTREFTVKSTTVVIVAIVAVAVVVGLLDYAFAQGVLGLASLPI